MKNKIFTGLLFIFFIISSIISLILYNYNSTLELQLTKRDKIIQRTAKTDSVIVEKTKDYAKSIKDFNSEIIFEQNGKNLTSSEIVKVFNQIADDNNKLGFAVKIYLLQLSIFHFIKIQ